MSTAASAVRGRWTPTPFVQASFGLHGACALAAAADPGHLPWYALAVAGNQAVLGGAVFWPRNGLIGANMVRLPPEAARRGELALTFDDGPDPEVTPRVLDLLERSHMHASFFFVAEQAARQPALVREVVQRGHSVENHSYRHSNFFACYGSGRLRREIQASQALLGELAGRQPRFFRAPMGLRNPLLDRVLAHAGLRYISWTRRGYDTISADAASVSQRLLRGLAAGDVLLLHDGKSRRADVRPMALAVLPELLRRIEALGLRGVTLPSACGL